MAYPYAMANIPRPLLMKLLIFGCVVSCSLLFLSVLARFTEPDAAPYENQSVMDQLESRNAAMNDFAEENADKTILVGIFLHFNEVARRATLRTIYKATAPSNVHVMFVVAKPKNLLNKDILQFEDELNHDIVIVDVPENPDEGKTFAFLKHVVDSELQYDYVMKANPSAFIHFENLADRIQDLPERVYYGLKNDREDYMYGMGYALSWDLVKEVVESDFAKKNMRGAEHVTTGKWINHIGKSKTVQIISETKGFADCPESNGALARPYFPGMILMHQCDKDEHLIDAARHYFLR